MAKDRTNGGKQAQVSENTQPRNTSDSLRGVTPPPDGAGTASRNKKNKQSRPVVGGTAVPGAKSLQPRPPIESSNPQQQQLESYNREMRRRMERMGYNDQERGAKNVMTQRQKRAARLKERRDEQLAQVRRNLPGGKIDTNPRRVYFMIAAVAIAIVLLIVVFAVLRSTGVLH